MCLTGDVFAVLSWCIAMPGIITMAEDEWPAIGLAQTGDSPPSINARTTITFPRMPGTALVMA